MRVDVRIVAATNVCLAQQSEQGRFLPDLYARLETFRVRLPPLRERRGDIPILVEHYAHIHASGVGYTTPDVDPPLMAALQRAEWPHNLRQLSASVHRLVLEGEGADRLGVEHCRGPLEYLVALDRDPQEIALGDIEAALARSGNNVSRAASALGLARTTVYRRLRQLESQRGQAAVSDMSRSAPVALRTADG